MTQQVNLYQPIFRAQPKVFSATTILQAGGVVLLGLLLIYGYARVQVTRMAHEAVQLQAQQDSTLKRIEEFNKRFPVKEKNRELERQIAALNEERSAKAHALEVLSGGVFGNTQGFSGYLQGLARQRIEGLWLTGVAIAEGGAQLDITGSTVDAQRVPRYLRQLAAEQAFSGREFKTFQMTRAAASASIDFTLQTAAQSALSAQR